MVCGNMEVESSKSYIDNLYDKHEDKVGSKASNPRYLPS